MLFERPSQRLTIAWISASDIRSVSIDFLLRHDSIVIRVSSVETTQKLVDISMRHLIAEAFHFFSFQRAVYVMIRCIPGRPRPARSPVGSVKWIGRLCEIEEATDAKNWHEHNQQNPFPSPWAGNVLRFYVFVQITCLQAGMSSLFLAPILGPQHFSLFHLKLPRSGHNLSAWVP
jgi:hypothetical protein